ncbi:hypothetical protein GMES_3296 [Paraglaciecola mesophila KMM 241]|uniref:Uncharacterized protein n=1 Tax=Paraglaciecola mesophila KMM 241 TaxID=1128912 RepID=K6XYA1_9ALTE|nr:hypothetical protein GMES_3296 [Paraglaciecola mesophila KMM 241]
MGQKSANKIIFLKSTIEHLTLCQGANANVVGRSPVSICPSRVFCGELRQLVIFQFK